MITTKTHGILDYLVGGLLIAAPWLLGFADNRAATMAAIIPGIATLAYSLITDYECSLISLLPFKLHLVLDTVSGLFLILSPLLFHFSERIYWPHLAVGILELVVVLFSKKPRKRLHQ